MHDVSAIDDLLTVADRILRCFQAPFIVDAHELHTTVSMGIVSSTTHLASAENLVHNAGLAMLRTRSGGKSAYAVFDEAMDAARVSRWLDPASSGAPAVSRQLAEDVEPSAERGLIDGIRDAKVAVPH